MSLGRRDVVFSCADPKNKKTTLAFVKMRVESFSRMGLTVDGDDFEMMKVCARGDTLISCSTAGAGGGLSTAVPPRNETVVIKLRRVSMNGVV